MLSIRIIKNTVFIQHNYYTEGYYGRFRWNSDSNKNINFKSDNKRKIFKYTIPEYELEDKNKLLKNVEVKIYFKEEGWKKFTNFFEHIDKL